MTISGLLRIIENSGNLSQDVRGHGTGSKGNARA